MIKAKKHIKELYNSQDLENFENLFKLAEKDIRAWQPSFDRKEKSIDVIDFFSGCGGMSLGFDAIGNSKIFNLIGAIDINSKALESYEKNFGAKTLNKNIRELCNDEGIKLVRKEFQLPVKKTKPLIIIGCAPCQGFTAHRKKNWDKEDERNTLIGVFTETAVKLEPDFVVMENVPEILGDKYWNHYEEARNVFEENGYIVKQTIYNSATFGVPQARRRAIIIASKINFQLPIPLLHEKEFKTVRDAISDLPQIKPGKICNTDKYHKSAKHKTSTIETIQKVPKDGGSRPNGIGPNCLDKVNGFSDVYGRLFWDKPSITLTQYSRNPASGRFTHPEQDRGLTIREAARLQSFPDTFEFQGSLDHCFKQIGESVPPLLSIAVATQIVRAIINSTDHEIVKSIDIPVKSSFYSQPVLKEVTL